MTRPDLFDAAEAMRVAEDLAECDAALPAGKWEVATSNSFRRVNGPDGRDGGVLCAINQRDGHPDLSMSEENLRRWAWLRNNAKSAATQLRAAIAEVERLRGALVEAVDIIDTWPDCDDKAQYTNNIAHIESVLWTPSKETVDVFRAALEKKETP